MRSGTVERMDVHAKRLANLHRILNERFGGVIARLSASIKKDPNQTRFILFPDKPGGRRIGEKLARQLEVNLGLSELALDAEPEQPRAPYPLQLSAEKMELQETLAKYLPSLDDDVARSIALLIRKNGEPRQH